MKFETLKMRQKMKSGSKINEDVIAALFPLLEYPPKPSWSFRILLTVTPASTLISLYYEMMKNLLRCSMYASPVFFCLHQLHTDHLHIRYQIQPPSQCLPHKLHTALLECLVQNIRLCKMMQAIKICTTFFTSCGFFIFTFDP